MRPSDTVEPVSNFETNAASFRRNPARGRQSPDAPPERLKRRVMDIEDALSWAFRDELPKGGQESGRFPNPGFPSTSPMFSMVAFGTRVDNWSREPGYPAACGQPHPDAIKIGAAVEALARFAEQPIGSDLDLGSGLAALGADEEGSMRKALQSLVATVQRCAKLRNRPYWTETLYPEPIRSGSGAPMVARWETATRKDWGGLEVVSEEVLAPVRTRDKGIYPTGSHCPLTFSPDPKTVAAERAEYAAWWAALSTLTEELAGSLETIALIPPAAAQRPWFGECEQAKPPRVFQDLTASVYRNQARETAAAYRALGGRRSFGVRRGTGAAVPQARRSIAAAATA